MLEGEKVILRTIRKDDIEHWLKWLNDSDILKYFSPMSGVTREDEEQFYNNMRKSPNNKVYTIMTIEEKVIGITALKNINREWSNAEIGITIGEKDEWGKGYGADAIRVLIKFAFDRVNLHRVYLHVSEENKGGIRCYEKVGFKTEGVLRENQYSDGAYRNTVVMGILRGELNQTD
jgi:RimJ/RimL family protein N-acetyltransferase